MDRAPKDGGDPMIHNFTEKAVVILSWIMTISLCLSVSIFFGYLFTQGIQSLGTELIFGQTDPLMVILGRARVFEGIFPAMIGTLCLVGSAVSIAVPVGICSGIFLSEYAGSGMKRIFEILFDILSGIPSIVIGLFGFSLAVYLHNHFSSRIGPCLLISALSLAILVLPYIVRSTQRSLSELPENTRMTALALGANKLQNITYVLIPNALSGIISGIILAVGRCAEDTAVILLTGVVATAGIPSSLFSQYEALPFYIFYISNQYSDQAELSKGYGACLILLGICAVLFMLAFGIKNHLSYRTLYRARRLDR
jgi:phosphate transport system permease protein